MRKEEDKIERILSIYSRLEQGQIINKENESFKFDVAERTIQRDIADIRRFLRDQNNKTGEVQEIVFDRAAGGHRLEIKNSNQLEPKELLAVCKILLESRALVKGELFPIIDKLLNICGEESAKKLVEGYISNEKFHYIELKHEKRLLDRLWELERAIKEELYVKIRYKKLKESKEVTRKIRPVGIMFSEFYFYLTAFIEDIDKEKEFRNPNDIFPTIYRIDRLEEIKILNENFYIPYKDRFEEGEFRKRIQFMYGGRLKKIRFKYRGNALEYILDRLPTAKIIKEENGEILIQAEVFGDGIDRWIRSQGDDIYDLESIALT